MEEKKEIELVISLDKKIDIDDDVIIPLNNDEDTLDLTHVVEEIKDKGDTNE